MGCHQNIPYILVLLTLPIQFSFHAEYLPSQMYQMIQEWNTRQITNQQIILANELMSPFAIISSILSIFLFYWAKRRILIISIAYFIAGIVWLLYLSVNEDRFWLAILLRCFNGLLLGIFQMINISYILHFSVPKNSGFYGYLIQTMMFAGLAILNLFSAFLSWKTVAILLAITSFIFSGLIWLVPDIPIFPKTATTESIWHKQHRKNFLIIFVIMILQQMSGIDILLNNIYAIMSGTGIDIDSHLQAFCMYIVCTLATFVGAIDSDSIGRKGMWCLSSFGSMIGLIIYGVANKTNTSNWVATLGAFFYFLFYSLGLGPNPWMFCGELFPEPLRIETGGINVALNRVLDIVFPYILDQIKMIGGEFGALIFDAIVCFLSIIIGFFIVPEPYVLEYDTINVV